MAYTVRVEHDGSSVSKKGKDVPKSAKKGQHMMPSGKMMKDSEMKKMHKEM